MRICYCLDRCRETHSCGVILNRYSLVRGENKGVALNGLTEGGAKKKKRKGKRKRWFLFGFKGAEVTGVLWARKSGISVGPGPSGAVSFVQRDPPHGSHLKPHSLTAHTRTSAVNLAGSLYPRGTNKSAY